MPRTNLIDDLLKPRNMPIVSLDDVRVYDGKPQVGLQLPGIVSRP